LVPPENLDTRRYTFWLMVIYVGSGLGLLLTTCFLGLRRYLRQRQLQMPKTITGIWLTTGGLLILALLLIGALLPRPNAEYALVDLGSATSHDRDASRHAMRSKDAGKGDKDSDGGSDKKGEKETQGKGGQQSNEKGKPGDKSGGKSGSKSGDKSNGSDDQKGKGDAKQDRANDSKDDKSRQGEKGEKSDEEGKDKNSGDEKDKDSNSSTRSAGDSARCCRRSSSSSSSPRSFFSWAGRSCASWRISRPGRPRSCRRSRHGGKACSVG
jgi:hypothetical protein